MPLNKEMKPTCEAKLSTETKIFTYNYSFTNHIYKNLFLYWITHGGWYAIKQNNII